MNIYQSIIAANHTVNYADTTKRASVKPEVTDPQLRPELPQAKLSSESVVKRGNSESFSKAEHYFHQKKSHQDSPDAKAQKALTAYGSLDKEEKREEVQQLMGVDTFA